MSYIHNLEDTICALSTPPGDGGIAVLRVSGPKALKVARNLCPSLPLQPKSHTLHYCHLKEPKTEEIVDEVLVSFFQEGRSFTGQETIEISCHGGQVVSAYILRLLADSGARLAERGEFTFRSYMNGRVDLVQAEAILDLIHANSQMSTKVASRQLQGDLSRKYAEVEDHLLNLQAQVEAKIDFSTEDIQPILDSQVLEMVSHTKGLVDSLVTTYQKGRVLKEGVQIVLCGEPNVGKSSLFNKILGADRALVTEIEGTTRDVLEGRFQWGGYPVVIRDTAGLRESQDPVEILGIQKARDAIKEADWILMVIHGQDVLENPSEFGLPSDYSDSNVLILINQVDTLDSLGRAKLEQVMAQRGLSSSRYRLVSAKTGEGLESMLNFLLSQTDLGVNTGEEVYVNLRHYEALVKISERLVATEVLLHQQESPELIAFELQDALRWVHGLLGKEFYEQVIDRIFREFCLGK